MTTTAHDSGAAAPGNQDFKSHRYVGWTTGSGPPESNPLAELRARLAADRTLQAEGIEFAFQDGALHVHGRARDERTWFAIVNLASTFASQVVDRIQLDTADTWVTSPD